MATTILIMAGYFAWSFAPWLGASFAWLTPSTEWAYRLPILGAAYLMLLIILWIGYTMATTPSPIPLESPLDLEQEDETEKEDTEKKDES